MPEEINRMITDSISDLYFTTSSMATETLIKQHISEEKIHFVGNTMIDTLLQQMKRMQKPSNWSEIDTRIKGYILLTLHRPSNVDDPIKLQILFDIIQQNASGYDIIFPIHPRTRKNIETFGIETYDIKLIDPQGYLEFMFLLSNSIGVITDSGGVTEEATVLNIPCITLRNTTERPETVVIGTNELVGEEPLYLALFMSKMLNGNWKKGSIPEKWDGKAAERIVAIIQDKYATHLQPETEVEMADLI
jgi:UDP-N-acetylglucosamine 2-epimerase (non-hydrolysing)